MSDYNGYVPYEAPEPTSSPTSARPQTAMRTRSQGPPPPHAPQRERARMVAPGPGEPTPDEQEQVSRRLWERLEFQPVAGAPTTSGAYVPHERLSKSSCPRKLDDPS